MIVLRILGELLILAIGCLGLFTMLILAGAIFGAIK
jgi:hypothetical protein